MCGRLPATAPTYPSQDLPIVLLHPRVPNQFATTSSHREILLKPARNSRHVVGHSFSPLSGPTQADTRMPRALCHSLMSTDRFFHCFSQQATTRFRLPEGLPIRSTENSRSSGGSLPPKKQVHSMRSHRGSPASIVIPVAGKAGCVGRPLRQPHLVTAPRCPQSRQLLLDNGRRVKLLEERAGLSKHLANRKAGRLPARS